MKIKFGIDQVDKIVQEHLVPKLEKYTIFTFSGPLGAGKTTLIKKFLKACGVDQIVTSPTFNYVNTYKTKNGMIFNHFDLYRLPDLESFLSSGFDEYFYMELYGKKSWNVIEWPDVISSFLDDISIKQKTCKVFLNYEKNDLSIRFIEFLS